VETFIVRIYRHNETEPEDIAGLVEYIGSNEEVSFKSLADLVNVIRDACSDETTPHGNA